MCFLYKPINYLKFLSLVILTGNFFLPTEENQAMEKISHFPVPAPRGSGVFFLRAGEISTRYGELEVTAAICCSTIL
jgi:hypothetical protein